MNNIKDSFPSIFPTLVLDRELKLLFEDVSVCKITSNNHNRHIFIYLASDHIIPKPLIWKVEDEIKHQLFRKMGIDVTIRETFTLSKLYSCAVIYDEYLPSLIAEFRKNSTVASVLLAKSELTAMNEDENRYRLILPANEIARDKHAAISSYIEEVFRNRFQTSIFIHVEYAELHTHRNQNISSGNSLERNHRSNQNEDICIPEGKEINQVNLEGEAVRNHEQNHHPNTDSAINEESPFVLKSKPNKTKAKPKNMNSNVILGKAFEEEATPLNQVDGVMGEIVIKGQIFAMDTRSIRNEKTILIFSITDFTDSITVKMFLKNEVLPEILSEVKKGGFYRIKGMTTIDKFDGQLTIGSVTAIMKSMDTRTRREDKSEVKRVELHCHTKMSDMDAVSDALTIIRQAYAFGHKAVAITDHGVVQAFPEASHFSWEIPKDDPFKIIYGLEGYVVDDTIEIAQGATDETFDDTFVVFDLETTGFSPIKDKIIEIGAVKVRGGEVIDHFSTFVNPKKPIPYQITKITSITDHMVISAPSIEEVLPSFLEFIGDGVLVAHNAGFDVRFIEQACRYQDIEPDFLSIDTIALARILLPTLSKYKLDTVVKALGISLQNHHRAEDDARATAEIFLRFRTMLHEMGIRTLRQLNQFGDANPSAIRKMHTNHIILLAQNDVGRKNLYRLVSKSHLEFFGRTPRIPKSVLTRYREGILVGTACEAGELYHAILQDKSDEHISRIAHYYDYFEVQPIGNNLFLIEDDHYPNIQSEEDLQAINRKIIELGEKFAKPVVAAGDVHFLNPEDEVYRRIIMAGKGFKDADSQPPLYFRTTEEMLDEFQYLGSEKAYEVVVENPNLIADQIEKISPLSPDKCPPVIENSDEELRRICYEKAHEVYGPTLPPYVEQRLERELNSIISNGYAVMYIISQKLVWKSIEDGYLVGSRGSVGSSFAATMAGITEVNPLSPHYRCEKCFYTDFDSEEVLSYSGGCGFDMPNKDCPSCGHPLTKDGFDIPFETFLGFKGNKEPDIDLNFSGEYQAKAHKYTEELFGEGYTYRAGTIGKMAEKTAFGFVKKYYDERNIKKRDCEINRIVVGCSGVRRSTGQHPGGIIVLPYGRDINEFTPVQRPANDMNTDIITTHFDYHSIDHNLLKLDILGHDDPTMIRSLEDMISSDAMDNAYNSENRFDATKIPLDDPDVLSLFHHTNALGIRPEDIDGCKVGCLGIPEFGTDFVIQMVQDANPQSLSDLIRISGLSHGADVWLGNAQELIKQGQTTLSTCICTRDDIMVFLINKGLDSSLAFTIMESVRKGKGLKPEWEEAMREQDVPEWYIWSCNRISYMFPKAHAAAYVMMAYRIAYCKIHYPLAYYASYFGIRASAFSYKLMCLGKEELHANIKRYKSNPDLTNKEIDSLKDMRIVQEMYARGLEFLPINIYKAKAKEFQIIDGKLMPSLATIEGLGEKAAEAVEAGASLGPYLSHDDFRTRTGVSKTVIETMDELGLLGDLPKSNQLSFMDMISKH